MACREACAQSAMLMGWRSGNLENYVAAAAPVVRQQNHTFTVLNTTLGRWSREIKPRRLKTQSKTRSGMITRGRRDRCRYTRMRVCMWARVRACARAKQRPLARARAATGVGRPTRTCPFTNARPRWTTMAQRQVINRDARHARDRHPRLTGILRESKSWGSQS